MNGSESISAMFPRNGTVPDEMHLNGDAKHGLTPREIEVLRLMGEGLNTKTIASQLNIAFKTAACHRSRVLQKLGVGGTVAAVRYAIRQGIIAP